VGLSGLKACAHSLKPSQAILHFGCGQDPTVQLYEHFGFSQTFWH